jgi:hypothetical protein
VDADVVVVAVADVVTWEIWVWNMDVDGNVVVVSW